MKTKLISEGDSVRIILTPENEFEKDIIEKVESGQVYSGSVEKFDVTTSFSSEARTGYNMSHAIKINIKKIKI